MVLRRSLDGAFTEGKGNRIFAPTATVKGNVMKWYTNAWKMLPGTIGYIHLAVIAVIGLSWYLSATEPSIYHPIAIIGILAGLAALPPVALCIDDL